ncbi:GH15 family glucan-1,4-alpha-glucosidase [Okibacterium sp. HSC-33S16]|uniref:glycoside hydrolase family 15 protein n=1 Tax=Okibacterium sp. HSC-33S16 TaxID=2910965 RepID=UPI0020A19149|nr:glycoside hydrolase family 15 protein [Okibacterium sp. HSC-33S16]MCP2032904.1 GH15 family glucan-1,4-alpha-glucosidase [Okibacterium sp. HSC-33S16]
MTAKRGTGPLRPANPAGALERTDGYADLRGYAGIGDGRTVALIALDGSVDWLPIPALDSKPVFAALLDAEHGGRITLSPVEPFTATRAYISGTNVLQTTFETASGIVRITDALVTGVAGRLPWTELARRVDGVRGSVAVRWSVQPGRTLRTTMPWVDRTANWPVIRADGVMLAVTGVEHGPNEPGTHQLDGKFTTSEGSRHLIAVSGTAREPIHPPNPRNVDRGIDRTVENWRAWSREFSFDGPWSDAVQRSALALKLLIHSPTGAIAAAATTSLPETISGGKNWDYRFAWVRDVAYTLQSMIRFGLREESQAAVSWLLTTIRKHGPNLEVFYTLDGEIPDEIEHTEAPGWRELGPVVCGNDAKHQLQLGPYGDLFDVMRSYVDAGNVLDAETGRSLAAVADRACDDWQKPDAGIWELKEIRHYTTSKLGCWQALSSAVHLAELGEVPGDAARWEVERDRIADWVAENCWSEDRQSYTMYPGSDELDASILLHAPSGFDRGERMSRTIDAIAAELGEGPLVYRYTGMREEEGTFVACAFWRAAALACVGRMAEAKALMEELIGLANDVGMYAEMIDADSLDFVGNLPQGLSHLSLIYTAILIAELDDGN